MMHFSAALHLLPVSETLDRAAGKRGHIRVRGSHTGERGHIRVRRVTYG